MKWLSSILGVFTGGASFLLNPWTYVAMGASFLSGLGYEAYQAHERQVARDAVAQYVFKQAEERTLRRIAEDKQAKELADVKHLNEMAKIRERIDKLDTAGRVLSARIKALPSSSLLSAVPGASGIRPSASLCFNTGRLDSGVERARKLLRERLAGDFERLRAGAGPLIERGASEALVAGLCSQWTVERWKSQEVKP